MLWALTQEDATLRSMLLEAGIDRRIFENIFLNLEVNGAGVLKKGHYVAASAFAYQESLNVVIRGFKGEFGLDGSAGVAMGASKLCEMF